MNANLLLLWRRFHFKLCKLVSHLQRRQLKKLGAEDSSPQNLAVSGYAYIRLNSTYVATINITIMAWKTRSAAGLTSRTGDNQFTLLVYIDELRFISILFN
jgi:hypothetical protein